jgi:hypothetical protein
MVDKQLDSSAGDGCAREIDGVERRESRDFLNVFADQVFNVFI